MACTLPSERVIVPSVPVTPEPALTGPLTGGQNVAQEPLHFEVVGVSGANQYKVNPLALVSTVAPPIVAVFSALLEAAAPEVAVLAGLPELAQAAIATAAAASPADASHLLFIACSRSLVG